SSPLQPTTYENKKSICAEPKHVQRNWGHLHKTRMGIWTWSQDILFPRVQEFTMGAWLAYSSPLPSNHNQLLSLFLMCCCIAVSIGGFFYCWMFSSLQYSFQFSATTASAIGFLALLTLFLVHPVRCMFTIIVPTLGTKQGRRLLLSACFMIVTANIIPNIMSNIRSILQVIKCICKDSSESLLTSTVLLDDASWDFARTLKTVFDNMPSKIGRTRDSNVHLERHNNSFLLSQKMTSASQGIKEDFLEAEMLVQKAILWANRITAGFVLFYLVFESSWYLKSYLTDLQFDNIYITKKLEDLARQKNATHLLVCSPKKLIKSAGLRLSREEFTGCLMRIFLVSLVFILTLVIITADYISFYLAQATVTEVSKLPVVPINFWIKYNAELIYLKFLGPILRDAISTQQSIHQFERNYHQNLTLVSGNCSVGSLNPPNTAVTLAVGLLYCIIYVTIFLETYSHRLCRKISASFFESQEDQRVQYLYRKLVRKYKKKEQQQQLQGSTVFY
ncbi:osteoclast stimulatory transmembrane protein, partial [Varanus komodoensis]|uniref:osteoclast stimulatory transmembrane protein n=1 Tax=Varanus komodoensis TaxID=61221 RepID=UPI001CF7B1AA